MLLLSKSGRNNQTFLIDIKLRLDCVVAHHTRYLSRVLALNSCNVQNERTAGWLHVTSVIIQGCESNAKQYEPDSSVSVAFPFFLEFVIGLFDVDLLQFSKFYLS